LLPKPARLPAVRRRDSGFRSPSERTGEGQAIVLPITSLIQAR
jgi:hypothetical protein